MSEKTARSAWRELVLSQEVAELAVANRLFVDSGMPPDWEGVAVLCRQPSDQAVLMVLQGEAGGALSWALPGGSVEPGETPQRAAVREAREETGLEVCLARPCGMARGVYHNGRAALSYHIYYFFGQAVGGRLEPDDPDGHIHEARWVKPEELGGLRFTHADQREILLQVLLTPP